MEKLLEELTVELLGLVLSIKVESVGNVHDNNLCFEIKQDDSYVPDSINLDTLARLMKEWASINGYDLLSGYCKKTNVIYCYVFADTWEYDALTHDCEIYTESNKTEFEAVLKATHWVAKEKSLI